MKSGIWRHFFDDGVVDWCSGVKDATVGQEVADLAAVQAANFHHFAQSGLPIIQRVSRHRAWWRFFVG